MIAVQIPILHTFLLLNLGALSMFENAYFRKENICFSICNFVYLMELVGYETHSLVLPHLYVGLILWLVALIRILD